MSRQPYMSLAARWAHWGIVLLLLGLASLSACSSGAEVAGNVSEQGSPRTYDAVVTKVLRENAVQTTEGIETHTTIELEITNGERRGERLTLEQEMINVPNAQTLQPGDGVMIEVGQNPDGSEFAYITEYIRRAPLYWLFALFGVVTIVVARKRGMASLGGMALSFLIIFQFIIPQILAGGDPLIVVMAGAAVIIAVTFYLSHGLNRKTTAAIVGTLIALVCTGILAVIFIQAARLSGFGAEETVFLTRASEGALNIQGLYLAGILIGLLGILDDITVSQAAIAFQLKAASPQIRFSELYTRTMDVGKDHIASLVNTLVLVYAGAALPLLLLFGSSAVSFDVAINFEMIAEEIVRTLVASIGLILAVPITTFITAAWLSRARQRNPAPYPPPPSFPPDWREH
ncbi:MAG: YibE/F family protein [Chloroflexi bacterium]|nr:YibE/F family protein [Chloroflexota bacterium]